ncbi:MAG: hypothetical protein ACK5QW_01410, partial [Cyanobacteriota bacterium]
QRQMCIRDSFYYVQIAPWHYGNEDPSILPRFWEAQAACLSIPTTGMVVTSDIGDVTDIHPTTKQEVGRQMLYINQRLPKAEQAEANARAKSLKDAMADLDEAARLQDADALRKGYIKVASSFGLYAQILPQAVQETLKQV